MGNSNSHSNQEQQDSTLQRSLDKFTNIDIPPRIRRTILELLRSNKNTALTQWTEISALLISHNIKDFVAVYIVVNTCHKLSVFLDDVSQFAGIFKDINAVESSVSSLSNYLLSTTLCYEVLTIEQELDNVSAKELTPRLDDVDVWFSSNRIIRDALNIMTETIFLSRSPPCLPVLLSKSYVLSSHALYVLDTCIHSKQRQWDLAFGSKRDGHSWASFVSRVESKGPMIVIVKSEDGAVFGAYTSASLSKSSKVVFVCME